MIGVGVNAGAGVSVSVSVSGGGGGVGGVDIGVEPWVDRSVYTHSLTADYPSFSSFRQREKEREGKRENEKRTLNQQTNTRTLIPRRIRSGLHQHRTRDRPTWKEGTSSGGDQLALVRLHIHGQHGRRRRRPRRVYNDYSKTLDED